jgi:hypothetical protein
MTAARWLAWSQTTYDTVEVPGSKKAWLVVLPRAPGMAEALLWPDGVDALDAVVMVVSLKVKSVY